jgi:hypothetical protein
VARKWGGTHVTKAREYCQRVYGFTCWLCGHEIALDDYTVDHVLERKLRPDLTFEPSNWRPAHGRKHPEFNCPGNMGRSANMQAEPAAVSAWSAPGW